MSSSEPDLIYVFLPEPLGPIDRGDKYEEPIIEELERLELGEVSGAGTALGVPRADGTRPIEACGIDVDTYHVDETRAALRDLLPQLGCPDGTQLQFRQAEQDLRDEYANGSWALAKPVS